MLGANQDLEDTKSRERLYIESARQEEWHKEYKEAVSAVKDSDTNLSSELRMLDILQKKTSQ